MVGESIHQGITSNQAQTFARKQARKSPASRMATGRSHASITAPLSVASSRACSASRSAASVSPCHIRPNDALTQIRRAAPWCPAARSVLHAAAPAPGG